MRIQQLELLAFGPFTNTTLDLSGGDCGLHIVYGPNEAGKSSTLRAINGLLFGIPHKSNDDFLHKSNKLLIGGVIEDAGGHQLHFHRRKGRKSTLLKPGAGKGAALPDDALRPFLAGVDEERFRRVFGIGNEQLEAGGAEMARLRGLVGESLFATTVGGPGLASVIQQLDEEATAIFHSRKKSTLKSLSSDYDVLRKERRAVRLAKTTWEKLQTELNKARKRRDEIVELERETGRQVQRLKRIASGLTLIVRRRETQARLEELSGVTELPRSYSAEERSQTEIELANVRRQIETVIAKLEGATGYKTQLAQISIPQGLLEFEEDINELKDRRAVVVNASGDRDRLERGVRELTRQVNEVLEELGAAGADLDELKIRSEDLIAIRNLANDAKQRRDEPERIRERREQIEVALRSGREALSRLPDEVDFTALKAAIEGSSQLDHLTVQLEDFKQQTSRLENVAAEQLRQLDRWKGSIEDVTSHGMPLAETVESFRERFGELASRQKQADDEQTSIQRELDEIQQALATLETEGSVPTESELSRLRSDRDARWLKVRDDWLQAFFNKSMPVEKAEQLAAEYTTDVNAADQMADRLRRETERVTRRAALIGRQQALENQTRRLTDSLAQVEKDQRTAEKEWKKLWKIASVTSPLSPAEMLGWLRRFSELQTAVRQLLDARRDADVCESQLTTLRGDLLSAAKDAGLRTSPKMKKDVAMLRRFCREAVSGHEQQQQHRAQLLSDISRGQGELEMAAADERRAIARQEDWQNAWAACMETIGCPADAMPEQANARISLLQSLAEIRRRVRADQQRIDDIDDDSLRFGSDVAKLAGRFLNREAVDFSKPTEVVIELHNVLQRAKADQAKHESLSESIHNATAELTRLRASEAEWLGRLAVLCQLAGVDDAAALPEKERESSAFTQLARRFSELNEQLLDLAGGQSLDDFVADAESEDADSLPGEIERLESTVAQLQTDREAAAIAVSDLEKEAGAADGNDKAALLDQQGLGVLSSMHDQARRYMQLRLAATMLRRQIEIHRSENEDPLLERASQLFARMTCSEFVGLRTDYDHDQPVIVGQRGNDEVVPVAGMSDGTRNQLYLALRLGYVEHQLTTQEPMPFIVDDILIHFDDTRAAATLKVLAELAQQTQVIFLTHHQHLVGLAESNLREGELFVHSLDSRNRAEASPAPAGRPR